MFHWRPGRRLPRDLELEVETLLADLRGVPVLPAEETAREASRGHGLSLRSFSRFLPDAGFVRLRRPSVGGSSANDNDPR